MRIRRVLGGRAGSDVGHRSRCGGRRERVDEAFAWGGGRVGGQGGLEAGYEGVEVRAARRGGGGLEVAGSGGLVSIDWDVVGGS